MAYLPLSTANLPDPAIDPAQGSSPEDYFDTALYTGNGTSTEVSTLNFQPDFVWGKKRSTSGSHFLLDSIRGVNSTLSSDTTGAEDTSTDIFTSFDSDGFTVGANGQSNSNGVTYVAWNWKANGSGVSNTDGSITSTVSANTESGFSVGTFVGNQTSGATVGHGLSQAPEMLIIRDRPTANDWPVYHASVGATAFLKLNATNVQATDSGLWNNTAPTASVFTLGSSNLANNNTKSHVFYAFHSVDGFSKLGSYTGNGSADGPFVYTGFRPAFVIIKNADFGEIWPMFDDKRDADNQVENPVYANLSGSEGTSSSRGLDFLSNGFKIRGTDTSVNRSGDTHIYMAFAENPFKYSNAR